MAESLPMGIGALGFSNLVFKRKFRFTFELQGICAGKSGGGSSVSKSFVKIAARPHLSVDETEINFLNAKTWIPGKAYWNTMTVTYIDAATADLQGLYNWLASVYDFTDPVNLHQGSMRQDYSATGIVKLWDGCGSLLEIWTLKNVWPTDVDFGDVDYASSDECTIALTLRYSDVKYQSICPGFTPAGCCTSCGG